jgi:hypothetical protein
MSFGFPAGLTSFFILILQNNQATNFAIGVAHCLNKRQTGNLSINADGKEIFL